VRAVIDYRPALRERSGVGEYTHQLARALLAAADDHAAMPLQLTLFSSSWRDRLRADGSLRAAAVVDRRVPVRLLNALWHQAEWPAIETLARARFDVAHSMHPLLMPTAGAAQVVTVHDLNFLTHPERTRGEIRRDYPRLARAHAHRADAVIAVSRFTARQIQEHFDLPPERITIASPAAPPWPPRERSPVDGYVLFFGTLEPRKNVPGLLDAYERLAARRTLPPLLLAGKATDAARPWLERLTRPPLNRLVKHVGYVDPSRRRELYEGARCLVQPSFEEGFGIPVLEAMSVGVPVVVTDRGALPEVVGDAGIVAAAESPEELGAGIERMLDDAAFAEAASRRGLARAGEFRWDRTARQVYGAYVRAIERRADRR
jgi:glycosyltransferase involved in cell wall biosynthesis